MYKAKMSRTVWFSLTLEEQLKHAETVKATKQKMKDLEGKHWLSLSTEDQEFLRLHAHTMRVARKEHRRKKEEASFNRFLKDAPHRLKSLNDKVSSSNKLFCMDLEFHEKTHVVTEVGVTLYFPQTKTMETHHFVVKEYYGRRNGHYVPDHKDDFSWGESQLLSLDEVEQAVFKLVQNSDYLVGHAFENDKQFLTQCGYFEPTQVLDTQTFSRYYFKERHRMSLERVSKGLGMDPQFLHNAGNDAVYTMKSLLGMVA